MITGQRLFTPVEDVFVGSDPLVAGTQPITVAATPAALDASLLLLDQGVEFDDAAFLVRVGAYLAGTTSPNGMPQAIRGVIYTADGDLVVAGDEVLIAPDQPAGWVTLPFGGNEGKSLKAGAYQYGLHAGEVSDVADWYTADDATTGLRTVTSEPYADGPPATLPEGTVTTIPAVMFLEVLEQLVIPANVTDDYLASLPFDVVQGIFRQSATIPSSRVSATCGWYGTTFDPTTGCNAIVRSDGLLADLVGERILVTRRDSLTQRSVAVYVHNELAFPDEIADEDLALTYRAFVALGSPALDDLQVNVEILA